MTSTTPQSRPPPVIETATSVQFKQIQGFGNVHLGLFWSRHQDDFPYVNDADPIATQHESFGTPQQNLPSRPRIQFGSNPNARLQMMSQDQREMLQLQSNRIVYNWRRIKQDDQYPRWSHTKPQLIRYWTDFTDFLSDLSTGPVQPDQWEVIYVNHFIKGLDWNSARDWQHILPGLIGNTDMIHGGNLESLSGNFHILLDNNAGRLHIDAGLGYRNDPEADSPTEVLTLQLTARGPIDPDDSDTSLNDGLELGHAAIVNNFAAITSEDAQQKWGQES